MREEDAGPFDPHQEIQEEAALERQMYKALHELQRLQSARNGERPPAPVVVDVDVSTDS